MSAVLAAKLLTLLTLAEVWLKMRAYVDLALAHADMVKLLDLPLPSFEMDFFKLLVQVKLWMRRQRYEEVARCHADMRALLEAVAA
ncbi:MAG: hypothetical protein ACK5X3_18565 [Pseudomonadota bacterium]